MPCTGSASEGGHRYAEALRLGGVAGAAADLLPPQAGQLGSQGGELAAELIVVFPKRLNFLLLSEDQRSEAVWSFHPIRFRNPGRRCAHHRRSQSEMQPVIKLPSRVQQD